MNLKINSPAYYAHEHGINEEIYCMCRKLSAALEEKAYSNVIDTIYIMPIIAPKSVLEKGLFKEQKKCSIKSGFVSAYLQIDYGQYFSADISEKKRLIINNVLKSVKSVARRGRIDYKSFEKDVKTFCKDNDITI